MKICTIVGARPQFIKAAAVSRLLEKNDGIEEVIVHTGQHYDANMSDQFFTELQIPQPKHRLNIGSFSHGKQTGLMLAAIEEVLLIEKPDYVLIYGDTNSTLAGVLAATKLHIPVAHIEAGLRSFNRKMPEEINRIAADHLSDLLFAPTENGHQQLLKEGIEASKIHQVGDVMFDAILHYNEFNTNRETLVDLMHLQKGSYVLATIHRAENTDCSQRLIHIFNALSELGQQTKVILPLHPRTRQYLTQTEFFNHWQQHMQFIEPVGYLDMLALEKNAQLIVTDSGGVQKEAYFNQVPCATLRNETEWVELVDAGWNHLYCADYPFSLREVTKGKEMKQALYGDGRAANKIIEILLQQ